jgi:hypothetical protein
VLITSVEKREHFEEVHVRQGKKSAFVKQECSTDWSIMALQ